jgi:hypothetical protein
MTMDIKDDADGTQPYLAADPPADQGDKATATNPPVATTEEKSAFVDAPGPTATFDARGDGDNRQSGRTFSSTFDQSGNADEPRV